MADSVVIFLFVNISFLYTVNNNKLLISFSSINRPSPTVVVSDESYRKQDIFSQIVSLREDENVI